nr:MAG TPA_asm: minor tail protein [Caudoviricetes sp.]
MKGTGESTDTLEKREKLLQKELEASGQKVELLTGKMEAAKDIFGENSIEANNWSAKLADAKRAQEAISQELSQTSAKLEEQKNAETQLSAEQLKAAEEARKQAEAEEQLKAAVGQTDNKIQELDQELQLNETKLEGAKNKTDLLKERQKLLGQESKAAADKTKILQDALDECAREVGEDSEKYAELKTELMESKIKQEEIRNEIKKTSEELRNQKTAIQTFGEGLGKFGEGTEKVGQNLKVVSTAAAGALAGAGTAAVQFESAFAGVKKTSDEVFDANGKCVYSYQQLEDGIRNMAKEIPASTTEISQVAEVAGQLGIKTQDVLGFTRVMIDMGNSTNLSAEDAATSIAKFANITGLAADTSMTADEKYKKMGSTIVDLGNNYATTEADIMNMATNLASAGTQVGMSESDILALATALSSVGMEAQAGGTAFSKALIEMQLAVETNSDSLKDWADVAGMSTSEFSKRFKEDATGALEAFIQGLSKCGGESDSAIKVLNDMGITETRMRDALLRSANASDVFTSAISTGKNAWEENTALTNEASKRYETTASKLAIMKNNLYDAGITLGNIFLPMIAEGTQKITGLIQKINNLDSGQQRMILGIVGIVAVLSPLLIGIGKVSIGISSIIGLGAKISGLFAGTAVAAAEAGTAAEGAGAAMAGAGGVALGPILLVTAAIAGVVAGMVLLWNKSESFRDFITGIIDTVKSSITGFLDGINIDEKLSGIQSAFSRLGEKLMGLENLFKVIGAVVTAVVVPAIGLLAAGFSTVLGMIEPLITVVGGVIDALSGLGDIIVGVFTGDMDLAKAGLDLFKQGVVEIFGGLWDMVVGALDGFISGITGFFGTLIQICGIDTFANGVIEKVSGVFDTIRNVVTVGVMLIAEIFSAAFQIITLPFQFIWVNCKDIIIQTWNEISTFIGGIVNAIVGVISAGFGLVKTYIITPISGAYASAVSIFEGIKSAIFSRVDGIKASAKAGFEAVKSNITGPINTAKSTVLSVFEGIKSGISSKINGARDVVKNAISTIKNAMNFNWKLPNLKLPHISIDGSFSLNPPSVPHFSIAWRAKGAVFDQPTIIPTRLGWQGVGEAGPEAVAPITVLQTYVEEAVERGIARLQRAERDPIDYDKLAAAMSKIETTIRYDDRELGRTIREVLA